MPTLHRFERVILAWALIGVVAIGPLSANKLQTKRPRPTNSVTTIVVPKGTQVVTLSWGVVPAVLPDREWNCGNGHGGFMDMFTYTPDQWVLNVEDLTNNVNVVHLEGTSVPVTYSCPGGEQPRPAAETGTMQIDVSSSTVNGDATFLTAMETTGEVRTATPGEQALRPIFCEPFRQAILVGGGISFTTSPPEFSFDLDPAQVVAAPNPWNTPASARVLTHKYGSDDSYPSTYQIDRGDVHVRPRFRFPGTAKADGSGAALKVWFRVVDPPDTAPYAVQANDAHDNDNQDTFSGGKGILMTPGCSDFSAQSTCAALNGGVLATTSAPDGRDEVVLETTDRFAGDNYQILASFSPPGDDGKFLCEGQNPNTCTKSAPITAWKRVYLETHSMFRRGSFLTAKASAGRSTVEVAEPGGFRAGDNIILVHADPVLTQGPRRFYSEQHRVALVGAADAPNVLVLGTLDESGNVIPEKLTADFSGPEIAPASGVPIRYLADAAGVLRSGPDPSQDTTGASFYYPDPLHVLSVAPPPQNSPLFDSAFVDYVADSVVISYLPRNKAIGDESTRAYDEADYFAAKWFEHGLAPNHQCLLGAIADKEPTRGGLTVVRSSSGGRPGPFGNIDTDVTASYVYVGLIEGILRTASSLRQVAEAAAHEIGHQWRVNPLAHFENYSGHDAYMQWDQTGSVCQMNEATMTHSEFQDGHVAFHYQRHSNGVDSEYLWIRERCEPIPREFPQLPSDAWWAATPTCP